MIPKKMEDLMNKQINAEVYSEYLYLSMSAYFEDINLSGFANWMREQAKEEHEHAMKFYKHIVERRGTVALAKIEAPKIKWTSPLNAFEDAYKHEMKVTSMINNLVKLSDSIKDYPSRSLLRWFVDEQVEEELQTDEIVQKLKMIKGATGGLMILDKELGGRKED